MFFHLTEHVYGAPFRDELIVLDISKDKYYVFDESQTKTLKLVLENNWSIVDGAYCLTADEVNQDTMHDPDLKSVRECIKELQASDILQNKLFSHRYSKIDWAKKASGIEDIDWRLPLKSKARKSFGTIFKCLINLSIVNYVVRFQGLSSLISLINKQHSKHNKLIIPTQEALLEMVEALNHACRLYPSRTKCLEWAATLTYMSLKRGWKLKLNIGAQNYPFLAHAWAETMDGHVIQDNQSLSGSMAIVLSAPSFAKH